jgi:fructose-1,6-bisphosphatase I
MSQQLVAEVKKEIGGKKMIPTLTEFLMTTQPADSKGDFTLLMMAIQTAVKVIEKNIRRAGIRGQFGYTSADQANASGDQQAKLDVIANDVFIANLVSTERVLILGSEEEETARIVPAGRRGKYLICFDPLDGSSNIDANVSVGTIWGIWKVSDEVAASIQTMMDPTPALLNPGNQLVSSGYAMYGSATNLVLSTGRGVNGFTLDASIGEFLLTHPNMTIGKKKIYSVNEGNAKSWSSWFAAYVEDCKKGKKPYTARYIGSMVADVHRTLLYGGAFFYPEDRNNANGKLRYLYEAAPMAFLVEQAGGVAETGSGRILDVVPTKLHQRVPVYMGSRSEIDRCLSFKKKFATVSKL